MPEQLCPGGARLPLCNVFGKLKNFPGKKLVPFYYLVEKRKHFYLNIPGMGMYINLPGVGMNLNLSNNGPAVLILWATLVQVVLENIKLNFNDIPRHLVYTIDNSTKPIKYP